MDAPSARAMDAPGARRLISEPDGEVCPVGWVHSYETSAGLDGPGWRFVLFLAGCQMRCRYCHNPDTWHLKKGRPMGLDAVMERIGRYGKVLRSGGVTISGGEPLVQAPFVAALARRCKARGLHVALDTAGGLGGRLDDAALADIDLVLLDVKSWDPATYRWLTGADIAPTLGFARRLAALGKPVWLRFVLVPGWTDDAANVEGVADFAAGLGNVARVDVLPFHQLGRDKWRELGLNYTLGAVRPPTAERLAAAVAVFRERGLAAV